MAFAVTTFAALTAVAGCSSSTDPSSIAGSYKATTLQVIPTGGSTIDVLAGGGTLSLTISSSNATTGSLYIPASLYGGTPFTADLAGTAARTGNTVQFTQSSDTFLRNLTFTVSGTTLQADQTLSNSYRYVVVLTRQ